MNEIGGAIRSSLSAVSGRSVGVAAFLGRWDRRWLRRTLTLGGVAAGAMPVGIAIVVATHGEGGTGGLLMLVFLPASLMALRALKQQLELPSEIKTAANADAGAAQIPGRAGGAHFVALAAEPPGVLSECDERIAEPQDAGQEERTAGSSWSIYRPEV